VESFDASRVRSPASPHKIVFRLSEKEVGEIKRKVEEESPHTWMPQFWKVTKERGKVVVQVPSTKVTGKEFEEIVKKFKYHCFGK
jgi:hypothetical protein